MLEVRCRQGNHAQTVDLAEVIWPRERPIHTVRRVLYCAKCTLRSRNEPEPWSPAAAMRLVRFRSCSSESSRRVPINAPGTLL
jgi:hypothetical protein